MISTFSRLIKFAAALLITNVCFGQSKYTIKLHAGDFVPAPNAKKVLFKASAFTDNTFQGNQYVVIQFNELPSEAERAELAANGIELRDYLPELTYTAVIHPVRDLSALQNARAVFAFTPAQKTLPILLEDRFPDYAVKAPGTIDVNAVLIKHIPAEILQGLFSKLGIFVIEEVSAFNRYTLRVPQQNVRRLLEQHFIQWVEPVDPPNKLENTPGRSLHRVNILNDGVRNLKGDGINIGIWDGGKVDPHLDFSPAGHLTIVQNVAVSDHSTHCSGTITGRGLINPLARGMAPKAKLFSWDFNGNIQTEMNAGIPANNLSVSSHSYGSTQTCGVTGAGVSYNNTSRETDLLLNNFNYHLQCHSAGNSQTACTGGWSTITSSGKTAKNNILVANITTTETLSGSSSCGPVHDGRVKPEISAMGTNVFSTVSGNAYDIYSGTSMSTPGVSGTVALLVERYKQLNGGVLPPSTLIKNAVLNSAKDLGNAGPDYRFGYGRINALEAVKILEEPRYILSSATTGTVNNSTITVPANAVRLRVMLTWNDPAAAANAATALVNNLDLKVVNGATTTLPWILDKNNPANAATRAVDNISNIEQVTIDNPAAGTYTLTVTGAAVPSGANQPYALTWEIEVPSINVLYPNGGEKFNPSASEMITWDNAGITGSQTIEYSLNNGANWTTLSTTVPATTNRFSFSVPAANTSTALVRISSGAITDQSDATFKILGTPATVTLAPGTGCGGGGVAVSWTSVTNATHYDIYKLNTTTGEYDLVLANATSSPQTISGLTAGNTEWFTVAAKNNSVGSISELAVASSIVVAAGGGVGSAGAVSGPSVINCGVTTATYSIGAVSGASGYTWNVPAGFTITGGQNTTSITVSIAAGASAGNISVFGSNGACQSNTSQIAVSISTTGAASATAGGSTNICQGNSVTLTASTGATYQWQNNGVTVGTAQTYVATTSGSYTVIVTSGSCSGTSNAIAVNVSPLPTVAVTASPSGTISQTQAVTLTATATPAGTYTYLWFKNGVAVPGANGATLILSSGQAGAYSVTATLSSSGCSQTSAAIQVTEAAPPLPPQPPTIIPPAPIQPFAIFPSPNTGLFKIGMIVTPEVKRVMVNIYDAKGARVLSKAFANAGGYQIFDMDMRIAGKGVYQVRVMNENNRLLGSGSVSVE